MLAKEGDNLEHPCKVEEMLIALALNLSTSSMIYFVLANFHLIKIKDRLDEVGPIYGGIHMAIALMTQMAAFIMIGCSSYVGAFTTVSDYFCQHEFIFNSMLALINFASLVLSKKEKDNQRDLIISIQRSVSLWRAVIIIPPLIAAVFGKLFVYILAVVTVFTFIAEQVPKDKPWWKKVLSFVVKARMSIINSVEVVYWVLAWYGYIYTVPGFIWYVKVSRGAVFLIIHQLIQSNYIEL